MALTLDLHSHLLEKGVFPESYWRAVRARKLDGIAITEHFSEKPGMAYSLLLEKKPRGLLLIPGIELATSIGHVLAFGRDESIYSVERLFEKGLPIGKAIKVAGSEQLLLSISHPWGLSYDSAAFILGEKKLERLVRSEAIGVEAFNGMFGSVGSFFYASNWVRKPMNFFDFLEKSRLGKKTRLSRLGRKGKEKLGRKGREIVERGVKPFELAQKASFATAGSDAHRPAKIGTGITKLDSGKSVGSVLDALQDKGKVKWLGPFVRETAKGYGIDRPGIERTEVLSGIKYAAKRALLKKVGKKP